MERLLAPSEYNGARSFISRLRSPNDAAPQLLDPPIRFDGGRARKCPQNAVKYCEQNTDYVPAIGFKLWILPTFGFATTKNQTPYIAVAHIVVRHKNAARYIDVTPPEHGDENKKMIFVPSSRLYAGWSAEEIAAYGENNLQPRMGSICNGAALSFKQQQDDVLNKATPEELNLVICPKLITLQEKLNLPLEHLRILLNDLDAVLLIHDDEDFCIMDANEYRHLYVATVEALNKANN